MGLVNKTVSSFYGGVTQQSKEKRLDSQCELQENCIGSILKGLYKRFPTEFISLLNNTKANGYSFYYPYSRSKDENYVVIFTQEDDEPIEVYKLDGTKCTIRYGTLADDFSGFQANDSVKSYAISSYPNEDIRMTSLSDYSIIVNKTKIVESATLEVTPNYPEALVYIKRGVASTEYNVGIDFWFTEELQVTATATYSSTDVASTFKTTTITESIYNQLVQKLITEIGNDDFEVTLLEDKNTIHIKYLGANDFTLRVNDSWANQAIVGIKSSVQKFTDLPPFAPENFIVKVEYDSNNSKSSYFLKFQKEDSAASVGIWKETLKINPSDVGILDNTTMPHRLVLTGTNQFTFAPINWAYREVGDEDTAPMPSFLFNKINNVFFFRDRLGFLSKDNIILSKVGDYFDFFPSTVVEVLDNDPIDSGVPGKSNVDLIDAIPFDRELLINSTNNPEQFILSSGENPLTPKTYVIDSITSFKMSTKCPPINIGSDLYFVSPGEKYAKVKEYYVEADTLMNDAEDASSHVSTYIPGDIKNIAFDSLQNSLFFLSETDKKTLYVYNYYWDGDQKIQSEWHKWTFDEDILYVHSFNNYLYLVFNNGTETGFLRINLEEDDLSYKPTPVLQSLGFKVLLDKQVILQQGTYDLSTDKTTWTLPYHDVNTNFLVIDSMTGLTIQSTKTSDNTLEAIGDFHTSFCLIGKKYTKRYRFAEWSMVDDKGNVVAGQLNIRRFTLQLEETGYLKVEITPYLRDKVSRTITGGVLGVSKIGQPAFYSGPVVVPVLGDAKTTKIELVNDSYLPARITGVEWMGLFVKK